MLQIQNNFPLKDLNTFHFDVYASSYIKTNSTEDLRTWITETKPDINSLLVLGGGSNILFTKDYPGIIFHPSFDDITILEKKNDEVLIEAGAGKTWDEFVEYCVENSHYGVENLSLIPGTVGAAPVQNIGAYGSEAKDVISKVNGIFLDTGKEFSLENRECNFGYRNSIFKNELKNRILITSVVFRLSTKENYNLKYGHLEERVKEFGDINLRNVRQAVTAIRSAKLPDPDKTGNAGSFFKNPEIPASLFRDLQTKYPDMPGYDLNNGTFKVPAGWLIDKAGWKGKTVGNAGVHRDQSLVLTNTGNATGRDILSLAASIENDIKNKFGITLKKEVIVI